MGGTDSPVSAPSISTYGKSRFFLFFSHQGRSLQTPPSLLFIKVNGSFPWQHSYTSINFKSFKSVWFDPNSFNIFQVSSLFHILGISITVFFTSDFRNQNQSNLVLKIAVRCSTAFICLRKRRIILVVCSNVMIWVTFPVSADLVFNVQSKVHAPWSCDIWKREPSAVIQKSRLI